jgi:NAD(P)-dependent dehydrogenase (short-subunit alcohol dehydrogenase family)
VAAPFLLTSLLLPLLKKKAGSRIVNVSSISQVSPAMEHSPLSSW